MPVITFSSTYPKGHIREGQPTFFVEKIWRAYTDSIGSVFHLGDYQLEYDSVFDNEPISIMDFDPKLHTIRSGNRYKAGDIIRPCVWLLPGERFTKGNRLVQFAPDIEIKKVWDFEITKNSFGVETQWLIHVGDRSYFQGLQDSCWSTELEILAKNDGLSVEDFKSWFKWPSNFSGQIICFSDTIEY